jgi:hypothetical protein
MGDFVSVSVHDGQACLILDKEVGVKGIVVVKEARHIVVDVVTISN